MEPSNLDPTSPAPAEASAVAQPLALPEVPATAAPDADAVTVNHHIRVIQAELADLEVYARSFLASHPALNAIVGKLREASSVLDEHIR